MARSSWCRGRGWRGWTWRRSSCCTHPSRQRRCTTRRASGGARAGAGAAAGSALCAQPRPCARSPPRHAPCMRGPRPAACCLHAPPRSGLTLAGYALGGAALLHVLALLASEWSTRFKAAVRFLKARSLAAADWVMVVPEKFAGSQELVQLDRRTLVGARVGGVEHAHGCLCYPQLLSACGVLLCSLLVVHALCSKPRAALLLLCCAARGPERDRGAWLPVQEAAVCVPGGQQQL